MEHFVSAPAGTFETVSKEARRLAKEGVPVEPEPLRKSDRRARVAPAFFAMTDHIAAPDVARALGLSNRMVRVLLRQWVKGGMCDAF